MGTKGYYKGTIPLYLKGNGYLSLKRYPYTLISFDTFWGFLSKIRVFWKKPALQLYRPLQIVTVMRDKTNAKGSPPGRENTLETVYKPYTRGNFGGIECLK